MHNATGIFQARPDAARAVEALRAAGFSDEDVNLLTPGSNPSTVPTTDGEQPGLGRVIGGVAGGATGAAVGVQMLAAAATGMVPGVGPVLAVGAVAALLAGIGGAAAGHAIETTLTEGLPKDELYLYEEALRQGRTVVIVLTPDAQRAERARRILQEAGAESLDAAREKWWVGLRDIEALASGDPALFAKEESVLRRGFEMAVRLRGQSFEESEQHCRQRDPDVYHHAAYRRGFDRGREYSQRRLMPGER
jgi:hypothetical protein